MKPEEKLARIQLIRTNRIGPIAFGALLKRYGSAVEARAAIPEMIKKSRINIDLVPLSQIEDEIAKTEKIGGKIVVRGEEEYPSAFDNYEDAPGCVALIGHSVLLEKPAVAIVGSRNASANAISYSQKLAQEIGEKGYTVISGFARGIDTAAHTGSLATGTVAVLAGGIDQIYPRDNKKLYHSIAESGLLIAEMPFGMRPLARHFPIRNRLIATLAAGTVVVEAGLKSGSLITAQNAAERGKEVMAVPGSPMDPRSQGCNSLIAQGAILVQFAEDIARILDPPTLLEKTKAPPIAESMPAQADKVSAEDIVSARDELLEMLSYDAIDVDELIEQGQLSPSVVSVALLELELAGEVTRHFGNRVARIYKENVNENRSG